MVRLKGLVEATLITIGALGVLGGSAYNIHGTVQIAEAVRQFKIAGSIMDSVREENPSTVIGASYVLEPYIERMREGEEIMEAGNTIGYGFLVPFFAGLGLSCVPSRRRS